MFRHDWTFDMLVRSELHLKFFTEYINNNSTGKMILLWLCWFVTCSWIFYCIDVTSFSIICEFWGQNRPIILYQLTSPHSTHYRHTILRQYMFLTREDLHKLGVSVLVLYNNQIKQKLFHINTDIKVTR
jgi:hypothetical protein